MRRTIGRLLFSLAARASAVIPIRADWNESPIFSPHWSPHARFHGVVSIGMPVLLAPVSVFLLWRPSADPETAAAVAALIPIAYGGLFFVALVLKYSLKRRERRLSGCSSSLLLWQMTRNAC